MRLLTYFAFTLLSVVIQFCVMDFIQEKVEPNETPMYLNVSNKNNKNSIGILKDYAHDAHALYYRLRKNDAYEEKSDSLDDNYLNASIHLLSKHDDSITTTTELSLTVYDVVYDDDNTSISYESTTESFFTSTDLDNVTEITLFEKTSTTKTPNIPETNIRKRDKCFCNLLYKQCDLHCCCDHECSVTEMNLFSQCKASSINRKKQNWEENFKCDSGNSGGLKSLFCIVKTNLPDKRITLKQENSEAVINDAFLWHDNYNKVDSPYFKRNLYRNDDPVWILRSGSVDYLELLQSTWNSTTELSMTTTKQVIQYRDQPSQLLSLGDEKAQNLPACVANNYCSARRAMKFLKNENIHCQANFKELEMFRVLKTVDESTVISVTNHSLNSTLTNCSSLYCTNWTIIFCDVHDCVLYNKSLHEPKCTESWCCNVAQKLEYIFHIYDTKIVNATLKFYTQRVSTSVQYTMQEISVQFFMGNASIQRPITLSGNPGYVIGLPIIVSYAESNHTINFFNDSMENYLSLPSNVGGVCVKTKITRKVLEFGYNKRLKCKIAFRPKSTSNGTETCTSIQDHIDKMLSIDGKMYISPYGNSENVNDDNWLPMEVSREMMIYGEFHLQRSKLHCFNLQTRVAYIFTYADLSDTEVEENKLLSARLTTFGKNITFSVEEFSAVIIIDINFIDANKLKRYDLAGPPHLKINLPRNFFLPSNECHTYRGSVFLIGYLCIVTLLSK